ncbi:MAG: neutral/alkaline non-lysosomal ceramidase N-terminal domain-containing protein [Acidobacteriaceae bacterium]|nr:neutral/alkaline non-lysosomal ceramidase N-terminal domain-containing protein [Acidobacteriaceae bacterium]
MKQPPRLLLPSSFVLLLFLGSSVSASAAMRAGAAKVDITPVTDPTNPPSGKYEHERLYVRAIVLENGSTRAALIGADQSGLPEQAWVVASKQIAAELDCPVANVLMSATHTHSGMAPGDVPGRGGFQAPSAGDPAPPIVASMLEAVRQAKAKLQTARVGFGTGFSYLNVNRDAIDSETHLWTQASNLNAASDKTVAVLKFETPQGQPIAAYIDYAMHPVNGWLAGFTSADFAGATSRYVEQAYDDNMVAIFVQGASGDQNPLYLRAGTNVMASRSGLPISGNVLTREKVEAPLRDGKVQAKAADPKVRDHLEQVIQSEGVLLGEEVIRIMSDTTRLNADAAIAAEQKVVTCPGRRRLDNAREGSPGKYEDGDPVNIRLGILRIGDIALASVDAEIYSTIGMRFKKESPLADTMIVTLTNGRANSGYIPNDSAFGAYTFQVLGSRLKPGYAETAIVNGWLDLMTNLHHQLIASK